MMLRRVLLPLLLSALVPLPARAGEVLTAAQAAAKVGQDVTMYMKVQGTGTITGGVIALASETTGQHPDALLIRITPKCQEMMRENKIADAAQHFRQKLIKVTGKVGTTTFAFGKRPSIEIDDPGQIEITEPEALHPPGADLEDLYKTGKLFQREAYKQVRAAFAARFESNHYDDLVRAYGGDYEALSSWFAKNVDAKENFYTALLEGQDNIPAALVLFKEIWKQYPESLDKWSQLAIATAVTWDQDQGIYDYKYHQVRVGSNLPEGMMDALENYKYVVDNEKKMPQPVYYYPWEFLVFVVNHRTPLPERQWAQSFFKSAYSKTKSWHQDVPYDMGIIKREIDKDPSAPRPKMMDHLYTLENIRKFGGVCAHQADFACRTAKCLGIPAVYCAGASAYRDRHAWWMYVYVNNATKNEIKFTLMSDGRFDGKDNYYTGLVLDPQMGTAMLDRDMERRLWLAGTDRLGKRLTSIIMRAYPSLAAAGSFDVKEKVKYLDRCLKVSKYNEDAWIQFALLAKRGELNDENKQIALGHLASLSRTFDSYPDFIWRIFDDLIEVSSPAEQIKQYEGVQAQFEKARRPDLACDARLKLTDLLVERSKQTAAFSGLMTIIKKYPTEGRYVPKMMKKLETVAASVKGGPAQVAGLYADLIPGMIVYYRSDKTLYANKMTEQARAFMQENNLTQASAALEARIQAARSKLKATQK
jgi:hypothetical protein